MGFYNKKNSFKVHTALKAAQAIEQGIKRANSEIESFLLPVADGAEGTMNALVLATNGNFVKTTVLILLAVKKKLLTKYSAINPLVSLKWLLLKGSLY